LKAVDTRGRAAGEKQEMTRDKACIPPSPDMKKGVGGDMAFTFIRTGCSALC
jgi:hypothetical protein